jgi:hypothetical protein
LEAKRKEDLPLFVKGGGVEVSKNLRPILLPQKCLSVKTILIKREVDDVRDERDEILFQEQDPNSFPFHLFLRITEEMFGIAVSVKDFRVSVGEDKAHLDPIEEMVSVLQNLNHPQLLSTSSTGLPPLGGGRKDRRSA